MNQGALSGIKVLDLSRVLAGPFCTQMLGDMGAEIIKVERPDAGDDTRKWGPPFMGDTGESAYYLSTNRNKKSIAIDLTTTEGQTLIHGLIADCDILIHNFKVSGLEKYGLEYAQIKERYPRLIYCAITGFGQTGPMAAEPGYDFLAQAMSGLMACTGDAGGEPMKVGVALSDVMTGLNAAVGILGALHHRNQTGAGQMIDIALLDCSIASLTNIAQYYLTSGEIAPRLGNAHSTIVPYQSFAATDGHIIIAVGNDAQYERLRNALGLPVDARFETNQNRVAHRDILVPMIADIIATKTAQEWLDILHAAHIPCAPVNTMAQALNTPQAQAREMTITMDHPLSDTPQRLVGSPLKFSDTPVRYENPPPYCGQHSQEILEKHLGLSAQEITQLKDKGIIQ